VEANKTSGGGGRPVRLKIPLGILIFLVFLIDGRLLLKLYVPVAKDIIVSTLTFPLIS